MATISSCQITELLLQAEKRLDGSTNAVTPQDHLSDGTEHVAPVAAIIPGENQAFVRLAGAGKRNHTNAKASPPYYPTLFDRDEKEPLRYHDTRYRPFWINAS